MNLKYLIALTLIIILLLISLLPYSSLNYEIKQKQDLINNLCKIVNIQVDIINIQTAIISEYNESLSLPEPTKKLNCEMLK